MFLSALPILLTLVMVQRSWNNERSSIEAYLALMPPPTSPPSILESEHSDDNGSNTKKVESKHKVSDKKSASKAKQKVETAHKESKAKTMPMPKEKREKEKTKAKVDTDKAKIIQAGDRVAQLIITKIELPRVLTVDELEATTRGSQGFCKNDETSTKQVGKNPIQKL